MSTDFTTQPCCGTAGIFNIKSQTPELRSKALKIAQKIRHHGPDWSGIYIDDSAIPLRTRAAFYRRPSIGWATSVLMTASKSLAVNGEIYNHRIVHFAGKYTFQADGFGLPSHPRPLQRQRHQFPRRTERYLRALPSMKRRTITSLGPRPPSDATI